jgi:hypothetical protein
VDATTMSDPAMLAQVLDGVEVLLNPVPRAQMVPESAWPPQTPGRGDLNAVPPLGIQGSR